MMRIFPITAITSIVFLLGCTTLDIAKIFVATQPITNAKSVSAKLDIDGKTVAGLDVSQEEIEIIIYSSESGGIRLEFDTGNASDGRVFDLRKEIIASLEARGFSRTPVKDVQKNFFIQILGIDEFNVMDGENLSDESERQEMNREKLDAFLSDI